MSAAAMRSSQSPRVRIGDICRAVNGRAFKPSEWEGEGLPIIRIQNLKDGNATFNRFSGHVDPKFLVKTGDLLFAWSGTPGTSFGAHIWRGGEALLNQHIFNLHFDRQRIDARFLCYALNRNVNEYITKAQGGVGLAHITKGKFENSTVPLPTLHEQRRIVAEIEKQFSRLDEAALILERIAATVRTYRKSVLSSLCADETPHRPLGSLVREPLRNGHSAKAVLSGTGVPTFTLTAVTEGDFSDRNVKQTSANPNRVRDLWVKKGDIFVERSNTPELVGTARLYRGKDNRAIFPDLLIRVRVNETVLPEWVELCLLSPRLRRYFKSRAKGIAGSMPKIDQAVVEGAPIPVPSIGVQEEIVADAERRFSIIAKLEAQARTVVARATRLRNAVLEGAFCI